MSKLTIYACDCCKEVKEYYDLTEFKVNSRTLSFNGQTHCSEYIWNSYYLCPKCKLQACNLLEGKISFILKE